MTNEEITAFLERIYQLCAKHDENSAIEYVYNTLDDLIIAGKLDDLNAILSEVDITKVDLVVALGFLTNTFKYSEQIPNHIIFYNKVEAHMRAIGQSEEDIRVCLHGLEDVGDYWKHMELLGAPEWFSGPKP